MLSEKDPAEIITVTFDFAALAETVTAPVVTATSHAGVLDPTPHAILSGPPYIQGTQVLQRIVGGVGGTNYALRCEIDNPDGPRYALVGVLPVRVQR